MPAKLPAHQYGHHRELTPAPSFAKSQYGGPPTASIPKTRDQPEELSSKRFRPCETTPRPGYRACHQPARRSESRQATRRTHRTQSKGRQAAPVPTTRTASQQTVRARPIAHLSRQIAALRTRGCTPRGGRTGSSTLPNPALSDQGAAASAARPALRVILRAGLAPAFCGRGDVTQGRRAAGARARGACTRPAGCGRRRSGARSSRGRRPGSRRRCVLRPWPR
jgi:hypothetical protein